MSVMRPREWRNTAVCPMRDTVEGLRTARERHFRVTRRRGARFRIGVPQSGLSARVPWFWVPTREIFLIFSPRVLPVIAKACEKCQDLRGQYLSGVEMGSKLAWIWLIWAFVHGFPVFVFWLDVLEVCPRVRRLVFRRVWLGAWHATLLRFRRPKARALLRGMRRCLYRPRYRWAP